MSGACYASKRRYASTEDESFRMIFAWLVNPGRRGTVLEFCWLKGIARRTFILAGGRQPLTEPFVGSISSCRKLTILLKMPIMSSVAHSAGWANPWALDPGAYAPGFMLSRASRALLPSDEVGEPTI